MFSERAAETPPQTEGPAGVFAPPPADFYYIQFEEGFVPARTRDGREWPGGSPDSYAKLTWGGREILKTPVQSRTRTPTWPDQPKYNYQIDKGAELLVEFWVKDPIKDQPLCHIVLRDLDHIRDGGRNEFDCEGGARVRVGVYPPRHVLGLGFYYELRGADGVRVTRILPRSPAARLGLASGDAIEQINGQPVKTMEGLAIQSAINTSSRTGLALQIRTKSGQNKTVEIKEGPIYPLKQDDIALDRK